MGGTVHPLARAENDRGAVPDSFPANRMLVLLNPPAERQQALQQFLHDAHAKGSPSYHQWLTPEQFGARFGARDEDVQQVQGWLQSHGFTVNRLTKSARLLEFSGSAAQVREGLHAPIHQYEIQGKTYYSVASEVSVPRSIAPLLKGFAPLNNFPMSSGVHTAAKATYTTAKGSAKPQFTTSINGQPFYAISPEDFATQYNVAPVYQAGTDGTGQTIGIIGQTNIDLTVTAAYRKLFGLTGGSTQVVIDGEDPGSGSSLGTVTSVGGFVGIDEILDSAVEEAYLGVELSGAVAPKATVNYYIASGTQLQNVLALAAMRAIEDNQASVLSVTNEQCEQLLGPSGNQLWASLWEQAAAQGQTVVVTSGGGGPASCGITAIEVNGQPTFLGKSVNGIASTPWNVAVGATDFYYSDYATGGASAANDWNASNDANFGSLKAPLPEQPWDSELGLNVPFNLLLVPRGGIESILGFPGAATGGGPSSCSQESTVAGQTGFPYVCIGGYAKPSWQTAPGVPNDDVRDLPDLSLLASDGSNLSAYAFCMQVNDCAPVSTGEPQVTLAGGTSAAAPAFAGIMALVNQKFGRQGQANFVLYALANQQPSVFHDITVGTNDVQCDTSSPGCTVPNPSSSSEGSYGVYGATTGYDLASGLGSVDVNQLIADWNKISFSATTTSLQLSPASIEHGAAVSVTAAVTAGSPTPVPTGDVSIGTTSSTPFLKSNVLTLSSGSAAANWNFFPGGTYQVTAQYAGDGTFASSASAPSTLTVTPEPSTTAISLLIDVDSPVTNGGHAPFGSNWNFMAVPSGQNSQTTGDATGTATFTDGATTAIVPLNAQGVAIWSPQTLALGAHSVTVSYSGDASYNASTGGPFAVTVVQNSVQLFTNLEAPAASINQGPPLAVTYQAGASALVHVGFSAVNLSVPPTGSITVNFGSMTQTVPVSTTILSDSTAAGVSVSFPNVPAGTYALSASYAGDSNWHASTSVAQSYTFVTNTATPTTTTLSLTPSTADSFGVVTFTATVTATPPPSIEFFGGSVTLFANGYPFGTLGLGIPVISQTTLTATGSATFPASQIPSGSLQVTATFQSAGVLSTSGQGGNTLMSSTSAPVPLTVTYSDFTLSSSAARAFVKSGQSTSLPLLLGGPNGGSATVSLNCLPSGNFNCSLNPSSATVKGSTSASLTIQAFMNTTGGTASVNPLGPSRPMVPFERDLFVASASFAFAFALIFLMPQRRQYRRRYGTHFSGLQVCCALLAAASFIAGCGGGSSASAPPPPPQVVNTPPGTYNVVVTASSGAITHNTSVIVVVQ